jgi:antitoxin (DNA-binding transcriptional repressor) of toxin-antitoxin stability system
MGTVDISEAESSLSRLLDALQSGVVREIIIARNGRPAARLVAIEPPGAGKRLGVARGKFKVPETIDAHNDEVNKLLGST